MKLRHFSIRDLLWLFVVVALATCWGIDRVRLEQAHRNKLAERQKAMAASQVVAAELAFQRAHTAAANESLRQAYSAMGYEEANPAPADDAKTDATEPRTWSRGEFTLIARFERLDGENVILRAADGAEVSVPLKELSAADQCVATMAGPVAEATSTP